MSIPTHVDVAFPVTGTTVPLDHGYALYAALCHRLPALHEARGTRRRHSRSKVLDHLRRAFYPAVRTLVLSSSADAGRPRRGWTLATRPRACGNCSRPPSRQDRLSPTGLSGVDMKSFI